MYIFSVNASIFTMYAVSIASKSTLVNQWVSVVVANLSMCEGRLKSSYITKSPNFILFYESCIPGVLCSTCIQLSSFQQPPSHSSSAQSHPPPHQLFLASIILGRGPSRLFFQLSQTCAVYLPVSGAFPRPPGRYASVRRKLPHKRASLRLFRIQWPWKQRKKRCADEPHRTSLPKLRCND